MTSIRLSEIGKRFNRDWIFRDVDFLLESNASYAVIGPNGSGKSTLLQVISGIMHPTEGKVEYQVGGKTPGNDSVYRHLSYTAPYQEVIGEFTLGEMLAFHAHFKAFVPGLAIPEIIALLQLGKIQNKPIKYFSSGMKQRVKLAIGLLSDVKYVLLDEPCSNLDNQGIAWFHQLLEQYSSGRIVIIGSNSKPEEIRYCTQSIDIMQFKPVRPD